MADTTLGEMRGVKDGLIRKMVSGGAVLLAPITAPEIKSFTNATNSKLVTLDAKYKKLGRIAKDGAPVFTPDEQTEDVETWGELQPSRKDVTSKTLTVELTLQDTRRETLEIVTQQSFEGLKAANAGGEFSITDNPNPETIYYRAFLLGADGTGDDAVYFGRFLPRVTVSVGAEDWNAGSEVKYPLSMTAYMDNELGYSSKRFYGGPGWKARLAAMNIAPSV